MDSTNDNSILEKESTTSNKSKKRIILTIFCNESTLTQATICDDVSLSALTGFWTTKNPYHTKEQLRVVSESKRTCIKAWFYYAHIIFTTPIMFLHNPSVCKKA